MKKCEVCGKKYEHDYYASCHVCGSECFSQKFYLDLLKDKNVIVTENRVYTMDFENGGFENRKFKVTKSNGEIIHTGLWFNADLKQIPANLRSKFIPNATVE
jgi:hypothetical protein